MPQEVFVTSTHLAAAMKIAAAQRRHIYPTPSQEMRHRHSIIRIAMEIAVSGEYKQRIAYTVTVDEHWWHMSSIGKSDSAPHTVSIIKMIGHERQYSFNVEITHAMRRLRPFSFIAPRLPARIKINK